MKYLIAALSLLASVSAFARPIVVGVEQASFLPHYSVDEQGRYHGYARDVLDLFAAVEGVELDNYLWASSIGPPPSGEG